MIGLARLRLHLSPPLSADVPSRRLLGVVLGALGLAACHQAVPSSPESGVDHESSLATATQAAIYGNDDRRDYYEVGEELWRELTDGAIVSMMRTADLDMSNPRDIRVPSATLGRSLGLCADQAFFDQVIASSCSATLIDDDLILTAGHCIRNQRACDRTSFVFRYYMVSEDRLQTITSDDVFACEEIVERRLESGGGREYDHAIVRVARHATPRFRPAPVARSARLLSVGDPVTLIGFGSGLPAKVDTGGRVISARTSQMDYFEATTDAFGGHSGSGVFNSDGEVVGILVRGQEDYSYRSGCGRAVTYPEDGGRFGAEGISYALPAIDALCAGGYPSVRLCDVEPVCGDGVCSPGEPTSCPADCAASGPPASWTCPAEYFGTEDGCDCACGAYDPDCDDPRQTILNCAPGAFCDMNGQCAIEDVDVPDEEVPPSVPDAWTCDPAFYAAGDGCDCACGTYDPDCDDPVTEHFNCAPDETCSSTGVCVAIDADTPSDPDDPDDAGSGSELGPDDAQGDGSGGAGDESEADAGEITPGGTGSCASLDARSSAWAWLALASLAFTSRRRSRAARLGVI